MPLWKRLIVALFAAMVMTSGAIIAAPQVAVAQDEATTCANDLNLTAPSTEETGKTPVLLVHGRGSEPEIWLKGDSPMQPILDAIDESVVVPPFDYKAESTKWVAGSDASYRLAKTIVCYFLLYGQRVAVVAHSMGGLLTYETLDMEEYGVRVSEALGHIASIGSPFKGSWLATGAFEAAVAFCKLVGMTPIGQLVMEELCREANSDWSTSGLSYDAEQLEALPDLPEGITHKAIAGRIQMEVCFFACAPFSIGDGIVPSESATARYTDTGVGDGVTIFDCTVSEGAWCEHGSMLQDERVQYEVADSLMAFIASQTVEKTDFYGLQLRLPPEWTVDVGPGEGYLYSEIQYHNQDFCPPGGRYCPLVTIYDNSTSKWRDLDTIRIEDGVLVAEYDCRGSAYVPPVLIDEIDIGGETAQLYEHVSCPEYDGIPHKRTWVILSKQIVITDQSGSDGSRSEGFDEILAGASWS